MPSQARLLTLPREIRDNIYLLLWNTPMDPPATPQDAGPRYGEACYRRHHSPEILYPTTFNRYGACTALAQGNRQLRAEVLELCRMPALTQHTTYELDVMLSLLRGYPLWPTWTIVPTATAISGLQVNLRMLDATIGRVSFWILPLFALLNRLLHRGPGFLYRSGTQGLKVDVLSINILFGYSQTLTSDHKSLKNERKSMKFFNGIRDKLWLLVHYGLLFGKVKRLQIRFKDYLQEETVKERTPDMAEMASFSRLGYHWGVDKKMKVIKVEDLAKLDPLADMKAAAEAGEEE